MTERKENARWMDVLEDCRRALMECDRDSDYDLIERIDAMLAAAPQQPAPQPLTDEQIAGVVSAAVRSGSLSWLGFKKDESGEYRTPVLSPSDYQFARAIERAHGIKEQP